MISHRAEVGAPSGSMDIVVDGVRLAVARDGAGPPVICLHAIGHGARDFEFFAAAVSNRFEVLRIDWPGQGRSGVDRHAPCARRYADLLRGVVTQLGLADPILIGCSIGGAAAIDYASRFGVRALVLANSGGLVSLTPATSRICRAVSGIFAAGAKGAWWFAPLYGLYYRMVLPTPAAGAQRQRIVRAGPECAAVLASAWASFAEPELNDRRAAAVSLGVPVLVAWAMQDKINRFQAVEPTLRRMSSTQVVKFQGGHAAFLERPREFEEAFLAFADAVQSAPSPHLAAAE